MANSWFRLYGEFASDPKVQMLSETDQRRLIMMFCNRCNGNVTLQDEEVTFQLRISNDEWQKTKAIFLSKGFINSTNEVLNWDKRQYVSDSSAERVARHREKVKQSCNVTVTPQNRTEQNRAEVKTLSVSSDAKWLLNHLNLKANRKFKATKSNLAIITSRLKEHSFDELMAVINEKCLEWGTDEKMSKYLRPETLFNATKCDGYVGSLGNESTTIPDWAKE